MKTAVADNGELIEAGKSAPAAAVCPYCGNPVTLRSRRSMDGTVTYFYRHSSDGSRACPRRSSPVGRRKSKLNKKDSTQ